MSNLNQRIQDLRNGGKSWGDVAKIINAEGWRTFRGNRFNGGYAQTYFKRQSTSASIIGTLNSLAPLTARPPANTQSLINTKPYSVTNEIKAILNFEIPAIRKVGCIRALLN